MKDNETCDGCVYLQNVSACSFGTSASGPGCALSGGHAIGRCGSYRDASTSQPAKPPAKWMHFKGSRSHLVREGSLYSLCNVGASDRWVESGQYGNRCMKCLMLGGAK